MKNTIFSNSVMFILTMTFYSHAQFNFAGDFRMQMGLGGEKIASVTYTDGSETDLTTGTYFTGSIGVGGYYNLVPDLQLIKIVGLFGYGSWATGPENTDDRISLPRFPLELLAYYQFNFPGAGFGMQIGGGLSYHIIDGVSGSGNLSDIKLDFENSLGYTGEIAVVVGILSAGLYIRIMEMKETAAGTKLNANSVGFSLGLTWPPGPQKK